MANQEEKKDVKYYASKPLSSGFFLKELVWKE